VRASPKARNKFDATEVRRSSRAKPTVSYKDDVSSLLACALPIRYTLFVGLVFS
jgi:hypothetical protein